MREFASATVAQVEAKLGCLRDTWGRPELKDSDIVQFFLEEPDGTRSELVYHAFCDTSQEPVFFGPMGEISKQWLDADNIQFYFKATVDEFAEPGFLARYFDND